MARAFVFALDRYLSHTYKVFEFSDDPECILRASLGISPHSIQLDGRAVQTGEPVLIMHLRNASLMRVPEGGPDLVWARKMLRRYRLSLQAMARYLESHSELEGVRAIGGETSLFMGGEHASGGKMMEGMGFTIFPYHNRLGAFGEFWENFYAIMLMWAYNPGTMSYRKLWNLKRTEFWESREDFLRRFGDSNKA